MVNKRFLLGILVILLVLGLTIIGCNSDDTDNGNGNGGTFTLTDIPLKYNGQYAGFRTNSFEDGSYINGFLSTNISNGPTLVRIYNNKVILPTWKITGNNVVRYSGSDTLWVSFFISDAELYRSSLEIAEIGFNDVTFEDGSAKKSWYNIDDVYEVDNVSNLSGTWVGNIGGNNIIVRANSEKMIIPSINYLTYYNINGDDISFSGIAGSGIAGKIIDENTITITIPTGIPDNPFPPGTYEFNRQ
jgi:hypothetical protein